MNKFRYILDHMRLNGGLFFLLLVPVLALCSCRPYYKGKVIESRKVAPGTRIVLQAYSDWEVTVPVYLRLYKNGKLVDTSDNLNYCNPRILKGGDHGLRFYVGKNALVVVRASDPNVAECIVDFKSDPPWLVPHGFMVPPYKEGYKMSLRELRDILKAVSDETGKDLKLSDSWNLEKMGFAKEK